MIVQRSINRAKVGYRDQAIKLLKEEAAKIENMPNWRLYAAQFGNPDDMFVLEMEFENLAKRDEFIHAWLAKPDTADFWKKWNLLLDQGEINETWFLVDKG